MLNFLFDSIKQFYQYLVNQQQSKEGYKIRCDFGVHKQNVVIGIISSKHILKEFKFEAY
jgi:hypothetical protein